MKLVLVLILAMLSHLGQTEKHDALELNKAYEQSLDAERFFTGRYVFAVPEEEVSKIKGSRWFFFVEVEPEENKEWVSTQLQLSVGKKGS